MKAQTVEVTEEELAEQIIQEGYSKKYKTLFVGKQFANRGNKSSMKVLR